MFSNTYSFSMAGHSQFSNIKHRKSAQDQKRSKKFTKIRREIFTAAKSGLANVDLNHKLRAAVNSARKQGFPKEKIEETIKSAFSKDCNENYEEIVYEGYGPAGVAIIIRSLTDSRNRAASEIRSTLLKHCGSLGEPGSVSFLFKEIGFLHYSLNPTHDTDQIFEYALEAGASDFLENEGVIEISCNSKDFGKIRDTLHEKIGHPDSGGISWKPINQISLNDQEVELIKKLILELEDSDDVQDIKTNALI